jgi:hypothetical protein
MIEMERQMMKLRVLHFAVLGVLVATIAAGVTGYAQSASDKKNKVIINPADNDTIDQLIAQGFRKVHNYGAYWLVEATDKQFQALQKKYGIRAVKANRMNKLELANSEIDTTETEPAIPAYLKESQPANKRLRLVQFVGPVQTEWLEQLKGAGNVHILHYVPNNAYLVRLDASAEKNLLVMMEPDGPIQYVGVYQPQYKVPPKLLTATNATVDVRICVAGGEDAGAALQALQPYALGGLQQKWTVRNEVSVRATVLVSQLPAIVQLPDVLWVRAVVPITTMDEAADIALATSQDAPPPFRYMEFLTNTVGFSTSTAGYPVLDICDTGLDRPSPVPGCPADPFHPAFYTAGSALSEANDLFTYTGVQSCIYGGVSRVVYNTDWRNNQRLTDTDGHGTATASTAAGFDDRDNEVIHCFTHSGFGPGCQITVDVPPPYPPTIYPHTVTRRSSTTGFQYGLGVSPFGSIGASSMDAAFEDPIELAWHVYMATARISNNSWGEVFQPEVNDGIYDAYSQAYDSLTRDTLLTGSPNTPGPWPFNQEITYVFAGGNANTINGTGYGDVLVTPPATAKNIITVGACTPGNPGTLEPFTSFGPTEDGRIKPEIVAVGEGMAAMSQTDASYLANTGYVMWNCGGYDPNNPQPAPCTEYFFTQPTIHALYRSFGGTSMAAPQVSGAIQLLWWYFNNRFLMLQPSPAMSKAYIINSARYLPITNPLSGIPDKLPSVAQGMGRLDLARMFDGVPRVLRDSSAPRAIDAPLMTTNIVAQQTYFTKPGQTYEVSGTIADATKPFRVTLVWSDAPGNPNNFQQLVNDLELAVTINGTTYSGNYFDREFSTADGIPHPDYTNNFECVSLPAGQTGTWSIVMTAINIAGNGVPNVGPDADQDFALVVYNGRNPTDAANTATNDTCQTAKAIAQYPFSFTNNLTAPTYHNNHPSPTAARGGIEEFFKISSPTPGTVFNFNTFGSKFDTLLSVWKGSCGTLEEVVSNDNATSSNLQSAVTWTVANAGETYYVVVDVRKNGVGGKMVLNGTATPPPVTFTPSPLDFGSQIVGISSGFSIVTLTNGSSSALAVSSIAITGDNATDFSLVAEDCTEQYIPAGGTCQMYLSFTPTGAGARTAQLLAYSNITGSPHILPLLGNGQPPAPVICMDTTPLTYSLTGIGSTSDVQSVTITNCGTAALTINSLQFTGNASNDFVITSTDCLGTPIPTGGVCTVNIAFAPTAVGGRFATFVVNSDAASGVIGVSLSGIAEVSAPRICFSPNPVVLGNCIVGGTSTVQNVTITNCGTAPLIVDNITVGGANAGEFLVVSNSCIGGAVPEGGTCTIAVQFAPSTIGLQTGLLQVFSNTTIGTNSVVMTGNGQGSQPDLIINKSRKLKKAVGIGVMTPPTPIAQQTYTQKGRAGKKRVFYVNFSNLGNTPDSFRVQGPAGVPGQYEVRYFLGAYPKESIEITGTIVSGTYLTSMLAAGAVTGDATMLRVEVTPDAVLQSNTNNVVLTATSTVNPSKADSVQATVIVR